MTIPDGSGVRKDPKNGIKMTPMHCKSHQNVDPTFVCLPQEAAAARDGFKAGKVRKMCFILL